MSVTQRIAEYCEAMEFDDLPEEVISKAKDCILDLLGCMLGGLNTNIGGIVVDVSRHLGGIPESTIMGCWERVSCVNAAFTNSTLANALDFDDDHEVGHPGATIIPPAIAVAESKGLDGKDLLTAIVLGYETSLRIGVAIQPSRERLRHVWGLGTWQTFGSVVAAAKLMKLDRNHHLNALGIAGANAPVPSAVKTVLNPLGPTMVKNNFGCAAAVGVLATLLAKRGFTGPRNILDGETGFWRMYGSDQCKFDKMTEGLDSRYEILNVAFKPYPACRWNHPSIDAALNIISQHEINDPEDIREIRVRTLSIVTRPPYDNCTPKTMLEAQFSVPFSIAAAIHRVKAGPNWFEKTTLKNSRILSLARKVKLVPSEKADQLYPEKMPAIVEIDSKSGKFESKVDIPKGDPRNPMSDEELKDKFEKLASTTMTVKRIKRTIQMIRTLEEIDDVRHFIVTLEKNC